MPLERPSRRALLRACTASVTLLAGCSSGEPTDTATPTPSPTESPPADTPASTPTPTPTLVTPTGETERSVSGAPVSAFRVATMPDGVPFAHEVSLAREPSAAHPPAVRIAITNRGDREHVLRVSEQRLPFTPAVAAAAPGKAAQLVVTQVQEGSRTDGCWYLSTEALGHLPAFDTRSLAPGETLAGDLRLLNHVDNAECWPSGEYRFEQRYRTPESDFDAYRWWFTVVV